jgi:hypothetical protein
MHKKFIRTLVLIVTIVTCLVVENKPGITMEYMNKEELRQIIIHTQHKIDLVPQRTGWDNTNPLKKELHWCKEEGGQWEHKYPTPQNPCRWCQAKLLYDKKK